MEVMNWTKTRLKEKVREHLPEASSITTAIPGMGLHRRDKINNPENSFLCPRILKIVQGRKRTLVGSDEYYYGEDDILVSGIDMPNTSHIFEASPERPCMSVSVDLDKSLIAQLSVEMPDPAPAEADPSPGLFVQKVDAGMLDAFLRLVSLLDTPDLIPVLAPMITKEVHYRLLLGPAGNSLRLLYTYGTHKNQVAKAISWLRDNFRERVTVDELAEKAHMAATTFHRYFKETTAVSPLQFQKKLRLHEAQRLMLTQDMDAGSACEAVGYESLTQFNREYKRHFGEPPRRNVTRWRRDHPLTPALLPGE